ncbi:MAG: hypothetical protein IJ800_05225 [Clostridia bacterium]|nr:hypothetical protein [Clostridia bacterium]
MSDLYPIKGNEYFYIFGNSGIRPPAEFLFGEFAEETFKIVASQNIRAVNLLLAESDFASRGVKLKNSLLAKGISCHIAPIGDDWISTESYFALAGKEKGLLVCVGEPKFYDLAKKVAKITKEKLFLVPTDCRTRDILYHDDERKLPDYILINQEFFISPKRRYAAESFGEIVSSALDILDYKTAALCRKTKFDGARATLLSEGINYAVNLNKFSSPAEGLCFAGIKLSLAENFSDISSFSSTDKVADYLGFFGDSGRGERKYRAFLSLLPLYKLYLLSDISEFLVPPDFLNALRQTSEWTGLKEYDLADRFVPTDVKSFEIRKRIKTVVKSSFLKEIEKLEKNLEGFEKTYSFLYGGRKKLSDFSPSEVKKAIKAAAFSTDGNLLAFMKDDGFAEFI